MSDTLLWSLFGFIVIILLVLDLGVFHKKANEIHMKEALIWSGIWIAVALIFNIGIYYVRGSEFALQFLAGYLLEKSLSVDNLFVFLLVFNYFQLPSKFQHKILFWGILGALFFRAIFIFFGVSLLHYFTWMIYVFGAILIITGFKLAFEKDTKVNPEKNIFVRMVRRFYPVSSEFHEGKFFIKANGIIYATPMIIILLVIESTDIVFAVDSIPAILAISKDIFIIYTSNVFAILGLRALYFALAQLMQLFHYLHYGLSIILVIIGIKMIISHFIHIPTVITLGIIMLILFFSVLASLKWPKKSDLTD